MLSCNKNIQIEDVLRNKKLPWDWSAISAREILETHPDLPWIWRDVSCRADLTLTQVLSCDKPWDWSRFSEFGNLSIKGFKSAFTLELHFAFA